MFIVISRLDGFVYFDEFNINTQNTTKRDSDNYACGTTAILCNAYVHVSVENSLTLDVFIPQPQLTQALIHSCWRTSTSVLTPMVLNHSKWRPLLSQLYEHDCVGPCICMWVLAISLITITTTVHDQYKLYRTHLKHHLWRTASDILPSNTCQCCICLSHVYISALPFPRSSHLSDVCILRSKNAMTVDTS